MSSKNLLPRRLPVSAFSDELTRLLHGQITAAVTWGLSFIALRFVSFDPEDDKGVNVGRLDDRQWRWIRRALANAGLDVSSVGSAYGKLDKTINDGGDGIVPFHRVYTSYCRPLFERAAGVGARAIRVFGGNLRNPARVDDVRSQVVDQMGFLADLGAEFGLVVLLENEIDTAAPDIGAAVAIIREVNHSNLALAVDEGNQVGSGCLDPSALADAARLALPYIRTIHGKCVDPSDPALVAGVWTPENRLTRFRNPAGSFFDTLFAGLPERADEVALLDPEDPYRVLTYELEPHMARSERLFGRTEQAEFDDAVRAAVKRVRDSGLDPMIRQTPFWN